MKTLNIHIEDNEYIKLIEAKGDRSWHDFIMLLINAKQYKITTNPKQVLDNVDDQLKGIFK